VGQALTTSQAARWLGLSAERVRQLSDRGDLACQRTPLGRLYEPDELVRFAAARNVTNADSGAVGRDA
jgi:hypothetical protein